MAPAHRQPRIGRTLLAQPIEDCQHLDGRRARRCSDSGDGHNTGTRQLLSLFGRSASSSNPPWSSPLYLNTVPGMPSPRRSTNHRSVRARRRSMTLSMLTLVTSYGSDTIAVDVVLGVTLRSRKMGLRTPQSP